MHVPNRQADLQQGDTPNTPDIFILRAKLAQSLLQKKRIAIDSYLIDSVPMTILFMLLFFHYVRLDFYSALTNLL